MSLDNEDMRLILQAGKFATHSMKMEAIVAFVRDPARAKRFLHELKKGKNFKFALIDSEDG